MTLRNLLAVLRMAVGDETGSERRVRLFDEIVERGVDARRGNLRDGNGQVHRHRGKFGIAARPHCPQRAVDIGGSDQPDEPRSRERLPGNCRGEGGEGLALLDAQGIRSRAFGERIGRDEGDTAAGERLDSQRADVGALQKSADAGGALGDRIELRPARRATGQRRAKWRRSRRAASEG